MNRFLTWLRRKPKTRAVYVKWGDTLILIHDGRKWQALTLQEVHVDFREGTTATFVSLDQRTRHRV